MQNYLLCDEDIGGRKSEKAKELGQVSYFHLLLYLVISRTFLCFCPSAVLIVSVSFYLFFSTAFLTEDGLFDMIRASNKSKKPVAKVAPSPPKKSPQKPEKSSMFPSHSLMFE